ncbi:MAG: potassium channel family protein [Acidimicrobiales bacterium]
MPTRAFGGAGQPAGRILATRARIPLGLLVMALVYGVAGFMIIEDFGFLDAVYMTVTTLTTVGFGEIHPLGPGGRLFTITLICFGVAVVFDLFAVFTTLLTSGQLAHRLERRRMQRRIESLRDHYVICAYGRVGRAAAAELMAQGAKVVVVESKSELEPLLAEANLPYLMADSTQEAVLSEAGIARAKGLICAVDSDAVNVYITLSARALNPDLFIIARASSPESVDKLQRAGSNRVVSPYVVSGSRMASLALQPAVLEFADMVSVAQGLRVEEVAVDPNSLMVGRTVRQICEPHPGVMMLAVKKPAGGLTVPPRGETVVAAGDLLIVIGPLASLSALVNQVE